MICIVSVSHSQLDKHLIMTQISRRHPFCVAVMPPKKIYDFCGQWQLCPWPRVWHCALHPWRCSEASLTHMALCHMIGSFSQATSEDRHTGDTTACILIQFRGAYWRYWKNCPHFTLSANKTSRPNEQQLALGYVYLSLIVQFYSVQ